MTVGPRPSLRDGRLIVGGRPHLVLGAELHNSSVGVPELLRERMARVAALGANTVLAPISWDLVEPAEKAFDFDVVDSVLAVAREHGLKVILLWFGAWKNGLSSYSPAWIKQDPERFPLARDTGGNALPILSAFSAATVRADRDAFAAVMRHLRVADRGDTVVMVQVENEVGLLGTARDHSATADAEFSAPIGAENLDLLRRSACLPELRHSLAEADASTPWAALTQSWDLDELFAAVGYARAVGAVAAGGKDEHPIPFLTNAWLPSDASAASASGGSRPGEYPSGGPLPHLFPIWRSLAPAIDLLAPDIYSPEFDLWCARYAHGGPLVIPEMSRTGYAAARVAIAIGGHGAIGAAPFGGDADDDQFPESSRTALHHIYTALSAVVPEVDRAVRDERIIGFELDDHRTSIDVTWGTLHLTIRPDMADAVVTSRPPSWGIVLQKPDGMLLAIGAGFAIEFTHTDPGQRWAVLRAESFVAEGGQLRLRQILNGDETVSGQRLRLPYLTHVPGAMFGDGERADHVRTCTLYSYPAH